MEPYRYRARQHARQYGSIVEGKLLSGLVGHNICLDYFGPPSEAEARHGLSEHGEAPSAKWRKQRIVLKHKEVALTLSVQLPISGLSFSRTISVRHGECIAYFREVVQNERRADHYFHWAQHVTFGLPFLTPGDARVAIPGTKGITDPHGYGEEKALLAPAQFFHWPKAPSINGRTIDLSRPFPRKGRGFVAGVLLDRRTRIGFIAAVNHKLRMLVCYCFNRNDFPWVAIWEENLALSAAPWRSRTRARGLEFSTTPLPILRSESFSMGKLFGQATMTWVPARSTRVVHYLAFITPIPNGFGNVSQVRVNDRALVIHSDTRAEPLVINASAALDSLRTEHSE